MEHQTPSHVHKNTESKLMDEQVIKSQQTEIIPTLPTSEIVLKVTEIPPLDVFYGPLHKVVARRERKRRRIETLELPPRNEPMDIVWKDFPSNPDENLTRLSQFTRAYTTATMDKAIEISILLKEKEEKIAHIEQRLET